MSELRTLAESIREHCPGRWSATSVPRLTLVAFDVVPDPMEQVYEPMVCFVASGSKRTIAGRDIHTAGAGQMLLSSLELPVTSVVSRAPYRAAVLRLDIGLLADVIARTDLTGRAEQVEGAGSGLTSALMDPAVADAVARFVGLLDHPEDIDVVAPLVETEILYRLLQGQLGSVMRQVVMAGSNLGRVRAAAAEIRRDLAAPLSLRDLAAAINMSSASLHRHFKAATGSSPLQFKKHLQLQQARRLLLSGDQTAGSVARQLGFVSASQFNREYRRAYGLPPIQDAHRLRQTTSAGAA